MMIGAIVNPQAVNESGFDVFTEIKRSILYMTHSRSGFPIAFVAIGAMLVSLCYVMLPAYHY